MFQTNLFEGKTVLVSGGGSGIGYAIAKGFLELGARVWIAGRNEARLNEAISTLAQYGEAHSHAADIRQPDQVALLAESIAAKSGRLDILVNNAGGQFPSPAADISPKGWQAVVNTNLNGTWYMTQTMAQRFMLPAKSGVILNVVMNMYRGFPGMAHSAAARAAVSNLTKTLAVEWARQGIRINAIAPGIIQSSGLAQYPPELTRDLASKIPAGRLGSMEEVASLALYLASPLAAYVTGETIYMDGGSRLWGDFFPLDA